ncbi:MAG: tRNA uridine-5-carboxymethylaminomethyl(34) synthesis GTPase MnmE [Nitrospirae bacterium]|nr:tRNA uridine-5-carboxymethylaminomethyl(34) synthesis GTPase MnmE [Nitrospirota bacterium]
MKSFDDTIAAISTSLGYSGIGIVRLSGPDAISIVDKIFSSPKKKSLKQIPSHRIIYGHILNHLSKEVVDEVLVSVMRAPHTYTREDVVEINCHGGHVPLRRVLELVLENGARLAGPGEFTQRAFLNGRIDLTQAEAVLDTINAMTEQSQKVAMEQLSGSLSKRMEDLRDRLIELTAFVEAYIDFPEEDIELPSSEEMTKKALEMRNALRELVDSSRHGRILREGLKTAIIGRPNVGKSSLLNVLLEQDRAIVTEVPGTTRDVIEECLNINGFPVRIMDTAGIREARDIVEREGVERSLRAMQGADLILLVLDGSDDLHGTDRELIKSANSKNAILVVNKIDLPQKITNENLIPQNPPLPLLTKSPLSPPLSKGGEGGFNAIVKISALKGTGLDELREKISDMILKFSSAGGEASYSGLVTNIRHVKALEKALAHMNSLMDGINKGLSPELLSLELRDALDAIGEILGITTPEDILNKIFNDFCIGK